MVEEQTMSQLIISDISSLRGRVDGNTVLISCVVTAMKEVNIKSGASMCFALVEDSTGSVQITVFSDLYPDVKDMVNSDETLYIAGKLEITENRICILVDKTMGFIRANTVDIIWNDVKLHGTQSKLSH